MKQGYSLRSLSARVALAGVAMGLMMGAGTAYAQTALVQPTTVPESLLPTEAPVEVFAAGRG